MNYFKKLNRGKSKLIERACFFFDRFGNISYSQEGEDMILKRLLNHNARGFYVDIGAYHPFKYSNTYYFYKKGWRGINVDATDEAIQKFNTHRKRDTNLVGAISDQKKTATFYKFNEAPLNTLSKKRVESVMKEEGYDVSETKKIKTTTISDVLDKHLPPKTNINFLNIDVEGYDLNVLKSNNWSKYRPEVILIEEHNFDISKSKINQYLSGFEYSFIAKTLNTIFYINNSHV